MRELANGELPVSIGVTHLDGLVLARSAFHHSVNYRSVVLFGNAKQVEDEKELYMSSST
jgi:nitroimidazol reductase NimA-like FMN-containing flavoprotein (pyridoxamine 5'-phosphate oxidase superfamily)